MRLELVPRRIFGKERLLASRRSQQYRADPEHSMEPKAAESTCGRAEHRAEYTALVRDSASDGTGICRIGHHITDNRCTPRPGMHTATSRHGAMDLMRVQRVDCPVRRPFIAHRYGQRGANTEGQPMALRTLARADRFVYASRP